MTALSMFEDAADVCFVGSQSRGVSNISFKQGTMTTVKILRSKSIKSSSLFGAQKMEQKFISKFLL